MAGVSIARWMLLMLLFLFGGAHGDAMSVGGDLGTGSLAGKHTHARRLMDTVPKIVGGENAPEGRFSYMSSLKDNYRRHICGAVLINPNWVLTAAHCVHPDVRDSVMLDAIVTIGAHKSTDNENTPGVEVIKPAEVRIHDKYVPGEEIKGWDIALVKLAKPSEQTPIHLPYSKSLPSKEVLTLGWGQGSGSSILQQLYLDIKSDEECKNSYSDLGPHIICAFNKEGDSCKGDSGSPLLIADSPDRNITAGKSEFDTLIGLTSFGRDNCTTSTTPGGYTLVKPYLEWIYGVIEGSPCSAPDQISNSLPSTTKPQPRPSPPTSSPREPEHHSPSHLTPVPREKKLDPGKIIFKVIVNGKYQCQGVLVDPQWIATAAHCVKYFWRSVKIARIGNLSSEVLDGEPFIHPESSLAGMNDVAMIKLTERHDDIVLPELPVSTLPFIRDQHLTTLIFDSGQKKVHSVDMKNLHIDQCHYNTVRNGSICAGTNHTSLCLRDTSGAPLLQEQSNGRQLFVGILYWGPNCVGASAIIPLLYQPVLPVVAWMKETIDKK